MRREDARLLQKMAVQKCSATLHKPIKILCFKTEKCSSAKMQIFFHNNTDFFLKYSENSYISIIDVDIQ